MTELWCIFINDYSATLNISSVRFLIIAALSLLFKPTKQITLIISSIQKNPLAVQNNSGVINDVCVCVCVCVAQLPYIKSLLNCLYIELLAADSGSLLYVNVINSCKIISKV